MFKYSHIAIINSTIKSKNEKIFNNNAALYTGRAEVVIYALLKTNKSSRGIVVRNNSSE